MNAASNFKLFRLALRDRKLVAAEAVALTFSLAKLAAGSGILATVIAIGLLAAVGLHGVPEWLEFLRLVWGATFMLSLLFLALIHRSPIAAWMREQWKTSQNEEHTNG